MAQVASIWFYESDDAITARGTYGKLFLKSRPLVDPRHVSEIIVGGTLDSHSEPETAHHRCSINNCKHIVRRHI